MLEVSCVPTSSNASDILLSENYTGVSPLICERDISALQSEIDKKGTNHEETPAEFPTSKLHFSLHLEKNLVEKLTEVSDNLAFSDVLSAENVIYVDWIEAIRGWQNAAPYARYITTQPPGYKTESACKKGCKSLPVTTSVRLIDDVWSTDSTCPPWKRNVEPVTYRYIPNNGFYRTSKLTRDFQEWFSGKRSRSDRTVVTSEVQQTQKLIRRDLENNFRGILEEKLNVEQHQQGKKSHPDCGEDVIFHFPPKHLLIKEQQLMKSTTDLFMENFNSRLNALEKSIKTSSPVLARKPQELLPAPHQPAVAGNKMLRDIKIQGFSQLNHDKFSNDLFTVVPMFRPDAPLRPLEKLMPKYKKIETYISQESKIKPASHSQLSAPVYKDLGAQDVTTSVPVVSNTDVAKMNNFTVMEKNNINGLDMSGKTKIAAYSRGNPVSLRKGTVAYTMPSVTENLSSNDAVVMSEELPEESDKLPGLDLQSEKRTLPEIFGKRLSVLASNHRLL